MVGSVNPSRNAEIAATNSDLIKDIAETRAELGPLKKNADMFSMTFRSVAVRIFLELQVLS